jgi:hypothetical protein
VLLAVVVVASVVAPAVGPVGEASAAPSGFVTVPDSAIHSDLPVGADVGVTRADLEGSTMVSSHASTTEIVLTTPERAGAYLNDSATVVGSGEIALVISDDSAHEGRQVAVPASAIEAATGRLPEAVHGTHEDGSEWTRQVQAESGLLIFEVPHFSSNTVTFSGTVNVTGTYSDGSSVSYDLTDVDAATDPNITLTGALGKETDTEYRNDGESLSIAGNAEPLGPSGNAGTDPAIKARGYETEVSESGPSSSGQDTYTFDNPPSHVETAEIEVEHDTQADSNRAVVYLWVKVDGTEVYNQTKEIPESYGNEIFYISFSHQSSVSNVEIGIDESTNLYTNEEDVWLGGGYDGAQDLGTGIDPDVTVSAGGTSKSLSDGETKNYDISTGSPTIGISGVDYGSYDVKADYTERAATQDPSVSVNGNEQASHVGTLDPGQSATYTGNASALQAGTNTVNVSMGSVSSDAPAPTVDLSYEHEASDEISVEYAADGWTERYNTSRSYASTQENATLTVPFAGSVHELVRLEERTNGGTWSSVPTDRYSLDGSTLTVQLDDGDGDGDVDAGTDVAVRTTARRVEVLNGAITVTDPILPGEDADVEFRVDSRSSGFAIDLQGLPTEGVRYTYSESWSDPRSRMVVTASGSERLELPAAGAGDSARVTHIRVTVTPETGEAVVQVADPDEPTITMDSGASSGDDVSITYLEASTGAEYELYSTSRDRVVDTETADAGSVTFLEDDSAESLRIQSNTSSVSGGGGGMFADTAPAPSYGVDRPLLIMGGLAALVLLLVWATGRSGLIGTGRWVVVGLVSGGAGLLAFEALNPGAISSRIGEGLGSVVPLGGIAAIGLISYSLVSWWRSRQKEAATPETSVSFNLRGRDK